MNGDNFRLASFGGKADSSPFRGKHNTTRSAGGFFTFENVMIDTKSSDSTSLSGRFVITARLEGPGNLESVKALCEVLDHFVAAIGLGMFSPAELVSNPSAKEQAGGYYQVRTFEASSVELAVFGVLSGMLRYFDQIIAPLVHYQCQQHGGARDLLAVREKPMSVPNNLPFEIEVILPKGSAPELLVSVEFVTPIPENERASYISEISIWNTLLQGGFAFAEDPVGTSGVGASSSIFVSPYVLHHHLDAWRASEACLAPLFNLITRWHNRVGVSRVEVS